MLKKILRVILSRRTVVVLLLLLQIFGLAFMLVHSGRASQVVSLLLTLVSYIVVIYIINRRDKPGFKLTWTALILAFPLLGGILYLMFRIQSSLSMMQRKFSKFECEIKSLLTQSDAVYDEVAQKMPDLLHEIDYLKNTVGYPVYRNTRTTYFSSGESAYARMIEELKKAESFIFLEYFIIDDGEMWNTIHSILKQKAAAGVDVRIMYDDMGCLLTLPDQYASTLKKDGIRCTAFNPFRPFWTTLQNNRDHRKICVVDGKVAFNGGFNIADEYINRINRFGHWKDTAIMLEGDAVRSFTLMFLSMWTSSLNEKENFERFLPEYNCPGDGYVQPYSDNPTDDETVGEFVYTQLIQDARHYLYISTPYLILDDSMIFSLQLAAKSGVDVRIITPHIPDKKLVFLMTRSSYLELIESGVRIYEYTPGFIHAKMFVSDDRTAVAGTANLDFRSLYLHFECGTRFYGGKVVSDIKKDFLDTLEQCTEITAEECKNRNLFVRLLQVLLRLAAPLM